MEKKQIKILAIETSCDETAAAVVGCSNNTGEQKNRKTEEQMCPVILSSIVSSQVDLHAKTGGVVPEVASRAHMESIIPVIVEALEKANRATIPKPKLQISNKMSNDINSKNLALEIRNLKLLQNVTHLAVTVGPGLIGSLLVGFNTAKAMAYALDIPIIPINHIEGHIYSAFGGVNPNFKTLNSKQIPNTKSQTSNNNFAMKQFSNELKFPILALTVSGGHTSLTLMHDHGVYQNVGQTLDDAAGEAFDKVAKLLDLGYPGGPAVSRVAEIYRNKISRNKIQDTNHRLRRDPGIKRDKSQVLNSKFQKDCHSGLDPESIEMDSCFRRNDKNEADTHKLKAESSISLPLPLKNDPSFNFSYSGLKTAVLTSLRKAEKEYQDDPEKLVEFKHELACVFEETAVAHLIDKTLKAVKKHGIKSVLLAGGVSANKYLREHLVKELENIGVDLMMPPMEMTGDNAAMIGVAAYYHALRGETKNWDEIKTDSNLKL